MTAELAELLAEARTSLKQKTQIRKEVDQLSKDVYPLEFESYFDFYNIRSFIKGYSESGVVDVNYLRKRGHGIYYQKISGENEGSSNDADADTEFKDPSSKKGAQVEQHTVRRSTRLSKKELETSKKIELEKQQEEIEMKERDKEQQQQHGLERIFENLVEKIPQPSRRSDSIMAPKNRYAPEKTHGAKPKVEKLVTYNKLLQNKKISSLFTQFTNK